ncbi:MAG: 3-hydroxybutyrate dehydrogenase [Legionellales bacterium]|nr:3-hydroxybutyrate dehydrogenase [Legionellales bacterium]
MNKLAGKVALITGAASGIGKAMAEKFAENGANVVIADIDLTHSQATATEITQRFDKEALGVKMDVTSYDEVNAGVNAAVEKFGKIDCLISNAGIQIISSIFDFKFADWKKLLSIHLDGGFLTAQACMNSMRKTGGGSIIFTGSVHSVEASKEKCAYVTAKHGLMGLTRAIAKEGAPYNIRANLIAPGFVKTPLVEKQIPEQARTLHISEEDVIKKVMLGNTVDGEFTTVDDVAETALFLAGFETNALTGQSLIVSHGWHMQ